MRASRSPFKQESMWDLFDCTRRSFVPALPCSASWRAAGMMGAVVPRDASLPTDVKFGDTALVIVLNPVVNDVNDRTVAMPGPRAPALTFTSDDGCRR